MSELVNHLPLFVEVPGANLTEHFLYLAVYMRLCLEKLYEQWIYVELQKLVQFFYVSFDNVCPSNEYVRPTHCN